MLFPLCLDREGWRSVVLEQAAEDQEMVMQRGKEQHRKELRSVTRQDHIVCQGLGRTAQGGKGGKQGCAKISKTASRVTPPPAARKAGIIKTPRSGAVAATVQTRSRGNTRSMPVARELALDSARRRRGTAVYVQALGTLQYSSVVLFGAEHDAQ